MPNEDGPQDESAVVPAPDGGPEQVQAASGPSVLSAPVSGIPVPSGAPVGYRGYGITSGWGPPAPQASVSEDLVPESEPEPEPDLEQELEPDVEHTDSITVVAPEQHQEAPPIDADDHEWSLRLSDGSGARVDGSLLIGRSPDPARGPFDARLVVVDDPARTVSRSHLLVEPAPHGALVLHNVSGVNALVVIGEDGVESKVAPGDTVRLTDTSRVLLGAFPVRFDRLRVV